MGIKASVLYVKKKNDKNYRINDCVIFMLE